MNVYDYKECVKYDVRDYINEYKDVVVAQGDREEAYDWLYDRMFISDEVTGNASGSYTFNTWIAEENLCHNGDLLADAFREFGLGVEYLAKGAEACDVTIRCYLLSECLNEVLDEMEDELFNNNKEKE